MASLRLPSGYPAQTPVYRNVVMFAPSLIRVKSLETPVTRHCNLRCAACDHASSYLSKSFLDAGQFERDLNVLKKAMTADEFRMVGGEPLQHPELETLIEIVRRSGIAGRVVLVTNGVLLDKASDRLWQSIDRLGCRSIPACLSASPSTRSKPGAARTTSFSMRGRRTSSASSW
jgi:hypothetical protein